LAILITLPVFVQASTSTTDIMAFKSLIDKKDVSAAKQLLPRLQTSPVAEYATLNKLICS
jgi:Zn-dependent membrane protease YugP